MNSRLSINALTQPLVTQLLKEAEKLRLLVEKPHCTVIDAGINTAGSIQAGLRIAEICMGGLGHVQLVNTGQGAWSWQVQVNTSNPVLACLGSQYAGWSLSHEKFYALGSGAGRILAQKEPLFAELGLTDNATNTTLVLEVDKIPPQAIIDKIVQDCRLPSAEALTLILTPTRSLAGCVQIVARVLEVAMHKVHTLHFPLERVIDGMGSAPLPPPAKDFVTAMGRTNDAILFGGQVQLFVTGDDSDAKQLAEQLPSSASRDYGKPFAEIFKDYQYDFFKIDPMLFSPAQVIVTALDSGRSFRAGQIDNQGLAVSFGE
ncbi:methenyltetrahydromethanopterin cyclohydrolase [Beggiatoa leptomitoformis]|nr:methenyltetrahydromethanopterin cyclohydrolase [Beggiatoa leptomitoformis]